MKFNRRRTKGVSAELACQARRSTGALSISSLLRCKTRNGRPVQRYPVLDCPIYMEDYALTRARFRKQRLSRRFPLGFAPGPFPMAVGMFKHHTSFPLLPASKRQETSLIRRV